MTTAPVRHRFTVDDLSPLVEAGVLDADARVELIEGDLIDMSPINEPHAAAVDALNEALVTSVQGVARVRVQNPVRLGPTTLTQPDVVVARRDPQRRHPGPDDVLLLIEVSDTTLMFDLGVKADLYARAGIREYWVADVNARRVHRMRESDGSRYRLVEIADLADTLTIDAFPDVSIRVADIFS